jgi:hypothetical protein
LIEFTAKQRLYLTTSASILTLLIMTFYINQSVFSGFWRFDDGWLLEFASRFSPSDYFFIPSITRGYSIDNLTPVNPFIFDINLWLFGVSPAGFYAFHLIIVACCAITTFFLLRTWLTPLFAFTGAALFLVGAPTLIASQQLMVGHYTAGLMLTVLAIYFYVRSIETLTWRHAIFATLFYVMATASKEVYVPLPVTLLFLPIASLPLRLKFATPLFVWSVLYALWRYLVLGSLIGGYDTGAQATTMTDIVQQFSNIPQLLFGVTLYSVVAYVIFIALLLYSLLKKKLNISLIAVISLAVLLPLVPLVKYPGITQPDRYLFLPWWLVSVMASVMLSNIPTWKYSYQAMISLLLLLSIIPHAYHMRNKLQPMIDEFDATYRFFTSKASDTVYFSHNHKNAYYIDTVLSGIRNAIAEVNNTQLERIGILTQQEKISLVNTDKYSIVQYNSACKCIKKIKPSDESRNNSDTTWDPTTLIIPLSPPYPPLFKHADGVVEQISINGNELLISGWTDSPPFDLEQQFIVSTPIRPSDVKITSEPTNDHDQTKQRHNFILRLSYSSNETAEFSRSHTCVFTRSMLTPLRLVREATDSSCQGFLKSEI